MKRAFLLITIIALQLPEVPGQVHDWSWARAGLGLGSEEIKAVITDNAGNVYVTGRFTSASVNFSGTSLNNTGLSNSSEMFLVKYDKSGNVVWAKSSSGADNDEGLALATDGSAIYVAGIFESSTLAFGSTTVSNVSNQADIFLVKYNSVGAVQWADSYGGGQQDFVSDITCDGSGNVYLTGTFHSVGISFGGHGVVNAGLSDAYLARISAAGSSQWAKLIGGAGSDNGTAVTMGSGNTVLVTGDYSGTLTSHTLSNSGGSDVFLVRYDLNGNLQSSKSIGGSGNELVQAMRSDGAGNIYMAGMFSSASLNLGSISLSNQSSRDMMLLKYNASLTIQWAKRADGDLNSYPQDLVVDGPGIYMSGGFSLSNISFGTSSVSNSGNSLNGFVVKYTASSGADDWAKNISGSGDQVVQAVSTDNSGAVYAGGFYNPTATIGTNSLAASSGMEAFIAKMCIVPASPVSAGNVSVCASKNGVLTASPPAGAQVNWYSAATSGSLLAAATNSFLTGMPGTYYAETFDPSTGCSSQTRTAVSLSVNPVPQVSVIGKTLTVNVSGGTYKWIECAKDSVLNAATPSYTLPYTGNYAVIVTANGCTDTTACKFYSVNPTTGTVTVPEDTTDITNLQESAARGFIVFPNPCNGPVFIQSPDGGLVNLLDANGQLLRTIRLQKGKILEVDINRAGLYLLVDTKGRWTKKLVVTSD